MSANPLNINPLFSRKSGLYRYSFNGKEKDNESFQGAYDFGARILDARLGRWMSVDAYNHLQPDWTPFRFGFSNPICNNDPDGNYEVVGVVSKDERKAIKKNHKGEENWRKNAKNEINELLKSRIVQMEEIANTARTILETDDKALKAFEEFSGVKKDSPEWEDLFSNNGKGPLIYLDPKLTDVAALTDAVDGVVRFNQGRSASRLAIVYLHEMIHVMDPNDGSFDDNTVTGKLGISWSSSQQLEGFQEVINNTKEKCGGSIEVLRDMQDAYKDGWISDEWVANRVEIGYAFEKAAFGNVPLSDSAAEKIVSRAKSAKR